MTAFAPTVPGNLQTLQRQIDRIVTARPGPMAWGPGDGHIRFHDGNGGTLFHASSGGALVWAHDALRPLGGVIESKASITYVDGNVSTLVARDNELQADINLRATKTYVDGNVATLVSRANSADSRLDGLDSLVAGKANKTYVDGNISTLSGRITTAQNRADSAYSRAGSALSDAATAQARADSAYSLAATKAAQSSVDQAISTINALANRVATLEARMAKYHPIAA
ncbi:hypothetical protein M3G50_07310 [Brachybacterium muris]|uniref:hypothetical protein n=1 Tax=Brachybacterium muris TaxID=219301 RepID=UPI0021A398BF|nr:hypothetical protein [Brachybacterium muris]MCT1430560.1 hypothetical protein [Brachybacterium muris]